jgi:hypothetical protein
MALTRGTGGLFPCPRDYTPRNKLAGNGSTFERRTATKSHKIITQATEWANVIGFKGRAKQLLKDHSLRMVEVFL